ncbi:hypothetical protein [Candidatus Symbiothrix dinenymphae]|uniref:hypothetical protein n=1 Tax=Candidatus Symbiothrix dinenymphae TaxID=467085 RepID=UPI0006C3D262|nr:hypothetical protein [Candidatus Symbiothrix dinenymphae]GAP73267.1 hypothetical protein SAMD00024442_70_7 [Candidatus Symbiothrix dinenymphae]
MSKKHVILIALLFLGCFYPSFAQKKAKFPVSGADNTTPSRSEYFSWINNEWDGGNAEQTRVNLEFFKWLHDTYGMQLDIYALDAGNIDGFSNYYGSMKSERFLKRYPNGFGALSQQAATMNTRLGMWGGPDGFGNTPQEAAERTETIVSLFRDHNFALLKLDGACGVLRKEKWDEFDQMMTKARQYAPDLVLLNHRLDLGPGMKHTTTYLLGGDETYIDVHMTNDMTAPHHRAKALSRELTPDLTRLTEDHGVCISSCIDYWEDDLILQAFNRNLILAPEIYGNPWLLRDDEYSYLAFIFNLHKQYNAILVNGIVLPEKQYGPNAVSRGDESTRLITLRNLTWEPKKYVINLDKEIGLTAKGKAKVRLYHPYIHDLGTYSVGSKIEVEVLPFRSALVKVTTKKETDKVLLSGIPYQIVNDKVGNVTEVKLLGKAGEIYQVRSESPAKTFTVTFPGNKIAGDYHRKLAVMPESAIPADAEALYYATCFAADNNALEVRSLYRSGPTAIPQVQKARDAFFDQPVFRRKRVWDKNMFDGDSETAFAVNMVNGEQRVNGQSAFMLDLGENIHLDKLILHAGNTLDRASAFISSDLKTWKEISYSSGAVLEINLSTEESFRYFRLDVSPMRLTEVEGYRGGVKMDRSKWRANNLFRPYSGDLKTKKAWKSEFTLDHINKGAYLCVALDGTHGIEGAWVGFKIDGQYVGAPDRAPSFASNVWEYRVQKSDKNYTYYLPLTENMAGKKIEAYVLGFNEEVAVTPTIWLTAYPIPFETQALLLE